MKTELFLIIFKTSTPITQSTILLSMEKDIAEKQLPSGKSASSNMELFNEFKRVYNKCKNICLCQND
jgi:hypothetical protein